MGNTTRMKHSTKFIIVLLTMLFVGAAYVVFTTRGDTRIGVTLTTNPDLSRGLVGHWTFDGKDMDWSSTTAEVQDVSGQGNHGNATTTMSASKSPDAGVVGQGMYFDGANDYVDMGDVASIVEDGPVTLSAWVNVHLFTDGVGDEFNYIVGKGFDGTDEAYFLRIRNWSSTLYLDAGSYSGTEHQASWVIDGWSTNEWRHVAGVYDGTKWYVYFDGALKAENTTAGPENNTRPLAVGAFDNNGTYDREFDGLIDDVRVYDRALSAAEVKRIFDLGNTTRVAETVTSNPTLEDGLVGHWTFDGPDMDWGSTTAEVKDRSGNGNHGNATTSMSATSSPTSGVLGQALEFDGGFDTVNLGNPSELQITGALTISTWVKADTNQNTSIFGKVDWQGDQRSYRLQTDPGTASTRYEFRIAGTCNASETPSGYNEAADGEWHHVVGVYEPSTALRVYVDGVLGAENTTSIPAAIADCTADAYIGSRSHIGLPAEMFDGLIDDVRVYDRALSAAEVKRIFDLGNTTRVAETVTSNPTLEDGLVGHWTFDGPDMDWGSTTAEVKDRSGQGNSGDAASSMSASRSPDAGTLGQGMHFDGAADYVEIPYTSDFNITENITLSAWIFTESITDPSAGGRSIIDKRNADSYGLSIVEAANGACPAATICASYRIDGGWYAASTSSSNLLNTWTHVVSTYDGSTITLYLDGVLKDTTLFSGTLDVGSSPVCIGRDPDGTDCVSRDSTFDGTLDDVRIYDRTLSAAEVKRLYELGQ